MRLGPYLLGPNDTPENGIYTGDARELARAIPDESIDLIFTDPVYDRIDDYRWLAETATRVLCMNRWVLTYYGIGFLPDAAAALASYLTYEWHHVHYMPTLNARGAYKTFSNYRGLLRYMKGRAIPHRHIRDLQVDTFSTKNNGHMWAKNLDVICGLVDAFTLRDAVILDPFCGGGTVPAVCKMLGRRYLAFEIDPDTAGRARERVRQAQPPLFIPEPEQLALMDNGEGKWE